MRNIQFIGEPLLARNADGTPRCSIATAFPRSRTIVTYPGIHVLQRMAYTDCLNVKREQNNLPPLTEEETSAEWDLAVDLINCDDAVLIRPDPSRMDLAFEADEMLQEMEGMEQFGGKRKVRFLMVLNDRVRNAIQRRGEAWRIHSLPKSAEQMRRMIADSRICIGGRRIYYYNPSSGTRWLTYQEFAELGKLSDDDLRRHLVEIGDYSAKFNPRYRPEVDFFKAKNFDAKDFAGIGLPAMDNVQLRAAYEKLRNKFQAAVPLTLLADDMQCDDWFKAMYCALIDPREDTVTEETLLGLSSDFFMQVEWLPGARMEKGEVIFDSTFDERRATFSQTSSTPWEDTVRRIICNMVQVFGDLEYINVGRVSNDIARPHSSEGRRDVFVAQVKPCDQEKELLLFVRMRKWDVREKLDQGCDLLRAMIEAEGYTEYIQDRRVACRQLRMNLSPRVATHKLNERYSGRQRQLEGLEIRSVYFQREFIKGIASCKVPPIKLADVRYAERLARLLGWAAAPNLIVGRCDVQNRAIFDAGDEVIIEDERGMPVDLLVADHTGTFSNFLGPLSELAPQYSIAIERRRKHLSDPDGFRKAYVEAFVERFEAIQAEYRRRRRAFEGLFAFRKVDPKGNLAYRWLKVLERLDAAKPRELADLIR